MPQIPLFVSSAKASADSTGSFSIDFQPPLELPAAAKNATIEVQQMSAPYTSPNISAALDNNQLVVQLPNSARTGFQTMTGSSDPHRSVITIPSGLYSLDALEAEINHQINLEASNMGVGQFNKRATAVTEKTVNTDGTDGANIDEDPTPNFLSFKPNFTTNRLHIALNYDHSSIIFTDSRCTIATTLGFDANIDTTAEDLAFLRDGAVGLDILWRNLASDPWQQFSVTLPQQQARGYTSEQVRTDLNQLVEDYLYQNHGIFNKAPFNNMIATLTVTPGDRADTVTVLLTYTDATKCKIRGDASDTTSNLASLSSGQLRAGLPNPAFSGHDRKSLGNPYATSSSYFFALREVVYGAAFPPVNSNPSTAEQTTATFIAAIGANAPGVQCIIPTTFTIGTTWVTTSNTGAATAKLAAHIDSITELGLAIEPIVQGPRDTSGKVSGTLARFVIPGGAQPGDVLAFETSNPTKVSVQSFVGTDINRLTFRLVDQHNDPVTDLQGEHFSAVVLFSYDN